MDEELIPGTTTLSPHRDAAEDVPQKIGLDVEGGAPFQYIKKQQHHYSADRQGGPATPAVTRLPASRQRLGNDPAMRPINSQMATAALAANQNVDQFGKGKEADHPSRCPAETAGETPA